MGSRCHRQGREASILLSQAHFLLQSSEKVLHFAYIKAQLKLTAGLQMTLAWTRPQTGKQPGLDLAEVVEIYGVS